MSWYSALLDGFLKIQIHPEEENFSTSEPRIWMYPPDKTIPTNDNFFLRSNIHAVIVSSIEKSVDIRPPSPFSRHSRKSFASVYVYKHTVPYETIVSIIRSINEHQLWNSRSRGWFSRSTTKYSCLVRRRAEKLSL